jgi:hypothetical protein
VLFADLEAQVEQLKASEVDLKNLFYREKDAREVLDYDYKQLVHESNMHMELWIASDRDLVNSYKSMQKTARGCGGSSRNSKKLRYPSQGYWCHIQADQR